MKISDDDDVTTHDEYRELTFQEIKHKLRVALNIENDDACEENVWLPDDEEEEWDDESFGEEDTFVTDNDEAQVLLQEERFARILEDYYIKDTFLRMKN